MNLSRAESVETPLLIFAHISHLTSHDDLSFTEVPSTHALTIYLLVDALIS